MRMLWNSVLELKETSIVINTYLNISNILTKKYLL